MMPPTELLVGGIPLGESGSYRVWEVINDHLITLSIEIDSGFSALRFSFL